MNLSQTNKINQVKHYFRKNYYFKVLNFLTHVIKKIKFINKKYYFKVLNFLTHVIKRLKHTNL